MKKSGRLILLKKNAWLKLLAFLCNKKFINNFSTSDHMQKFINQQFALFFSHL